MAVYSRYAPEFAIRIDGEPIPDTMRSSVSSVSYQTGIEGADRVEITLANPNLCWLDHSLLATDNGFKLEIGYAPDPLEEVFVGEITGVEPTFPAGGMPTIKVVAQDFLHRLTQGTKDRAFRISIPSVGNFPIPDVLITTIVSALDGLIAAPDPVGGTLNAVISLAAYNKFRDESQSMVRRQRGTSDFQFLTQIAKDNGWEMYIDHTAEPRGYVLRFVFLVQDYSPSLSLQWGESLMEFTPRLTTVGDVFGVSARIWIASLKMEFVIVVSWDYDRAAFNVMLYPSLVGDLGDILGAEVASKTIALAPTSMARTPYAILSELLPRLNNRLTGSGSTLGDLRIRAGKVINLEGLGEEFSGLYRITSATHSLDSGGYKTSFNARKEVWFGSIPLPEGGSGLARVQGQTIG